MCSAVATTWLDRHLVRQPGEHLREGVGGEHARCPAWCSTSVSLPVPAPSSRTIELPDPVSQRDGLFGVRRARSVVGVGHRAERPFGSLGSACSSCARSYPIAFPPCPHSPDPSPAADPSRSAGWLTELEGVPSAFAATRDGIDVMLRDRGLRRTTPEQTAESLLRGAHASAVLEGSASSAEEVRAGSGDADRPGRRAGEHRAALPGAGARAVAAAGVRAAARAHRRGLGWPAGLARGGRPVAVALADPAARPRRRRCWSPRWCTPTW